MSCVVSAVCSRPALTPAAVGPKAAVAAAAAAAAEHGRALASRLSALLCACAQAAPVGHGPRVAPPFGGGGDKRKARGPGVSYRISIYTACHLPGDRGLSRRPLLTGPGYQVQVQVLQVKVVLAGACAWTEFARHAPCIPNALRATASRAT
jgi:hypothetical protein